MRKTEQPLEKRNTERPRRKQSFSEESDQLSHLLCSPESKARISFGKNMEVIGSFFFFFLILLATVNSTLLNICLDFAFNFGKYKSRSGMDR